VKRNRNTTRRTDCAASFFLMQTNLLVRAESGKLKKWREPPAYGESRIRERDACATLCRVVTLS
jgi:hypothetical protein